MLDLARFLDFTGKINWWLNRVENRRHKKATLEFEQLEDRVVPTLLGQQLFPADYPWNQNIANAPVATNSAAVISHIGSNIGIHPDWGTDDPANGTDPLYGIPYNVVHGNSVAKINVIIDNYPGESDLMPVPLSANVVIEGDYQGGPNNHGGGYNNGQRGDSHLIVWDVDNNIAYELFGVTRPADPKLFPNTNGVELSHTDGLWHAAGEAVWDMDANSFRTLGATSADAAGLSILAGLARPDEGLPVAQGGQGAIDHAIRFTLPSGDVSNQYIYPASHQVSGSTATTKLPFGARLRLQNTPAVNNLISQMDPQAQIIAHAMQQYGLVLADIGSAMYVTGTSAAKDAGNNVTLTWNMDDVLGLNALKAGMFDVVDLTPVVTGLSSNNAAPGSTITITGQNFAGSAGHLAVFFGSIQSSSVTYVSDTQITAVVPTGSGNVHVTVQSGVIENDDDSSNPNANVTGPIFGYGTSTATSADIFGLSGGAAQTVNGASSTDSFGSSSVVVGSTVTLTINVKDTTGNAFIGLPSSAFGFSLNGGGSNGTFGTVTETATAGKYVVTFTGVSAGTQSTLTVTVNGVTLSGHPGITVNAPAFAVVGPGGTIAAATGFDRPTFRWNSFAGADHYALTVTDKTSNTTSFVVANIVGTSYVPTVAQALTPGHSFTISVSALNAASTKLSTVTGSFALAALLAPTGLTPSGTVAAAAGYDRPTLRWNAVTGADHYYLQVVDKTTATTVFAVAGIVGASYTPTAAQALTPGHSFAVTLYADSTNNKAYGMATQTFMLAPLAAPTNLNPRGTLAAAAGYDRPTFTWTAAAGADHYYLQVVDKTAGTTVFAVAGIVGTSYTPTAAQALTPGHTFGVTLYADSTSNKAYGVATQTFTLAALPAPTGLTPNGTVAAANGFDRPTFTWTAAVGADHYYLQVVDNTTGKTAFIVPTIVGTSYTATAAQALTPGHKYTTSVYSGSTNNKGHGLATQSFTLAAIPAATLAGPIGMITTTTPTFGWSGIGADHYVLRVTDDNTGALVINMTITGATSFTPTTPLVRGHKYTWRVAAVSTNNLAGTWTAGQDFTIS